MITITFHCSYNIKTDFEVEAINHNININYGVGDGYQAGLQIRQNIIDTYFSV